MSAWFSQHVEGEKLPQHDEVQNVSGTDWLVRMETWNHLCLLMFYFLISYLLFQMSAVIFLQGAGCVQCSDVRRGAWCPSWAAGWPAVRGADRAEGPSAVLWRSHRRRSGFCPLLREQQQLSAWLPPVPGKPGNGLPQYSACNVGVKALIPRKLFNKHFINPQTTLCANYVKC